ncbi:MAG: hypothetical protein GY763_00865 [Gammaproteobacteria bacterium]|nr:hypothetical protein [Gammaproteobacteria bacterium]
MKVILNKTLNSGLFGLAGLTALSLQSEEAHAYNMDCKVILCIAGGFHAQCSDAYGRG